jgi:putative hydrolase of HD superfamily
VTVAALAQIAFRLKHTDRAGWLRVGIDPPESVAAHSWGMALLALAVCPAHLDRERVLALCILHDVAEAIIGDITPHDGVSRQEKRDRERSAAATLLGPHPELWGLWEDYEQQRTDEAKLVKQLDRLDMGLQAQLYAALADTAEFTTSALRGTDDPTLRALLTPRPAADRRSD